jgi:hypothetical protein
LVLWFYNKEVAVSVHGNRPGEVVAFNPAITFFAGFVPIGKLNY